MTVWGDDTFTSEIDGFTSNELIYFEVVTNNYQVYAVSVSTQITYATNGIGAILEPATSLVNACN